MNNQELNNRRLASLCGMNPYSDIFNSQQPRGNDASLSKQKAFIMPKEAIYKPKTGADTCHSQRKQGKDKILKEQCLHSSRHKTTYSEAKTSPDNSDTNKKTRKKVKMTNLKGRVS